MQIIYNLFQIIIYLLSIHLKKQLHITESKIQLLKSLEICNKKNLQKLYKFKHYL